MEKRLNLTRSTIRKVLKDSQVEYRTKSETLHKYKMNHHAFDDLKKSEVLYFIGLLYTDGHIETKNNKFCIEIGLHSQDL